MAKQFTIKGQNFDTGTPGKSYGVGKANNGNSYILFINEHDVDGNGKRTLAQRHVFNFTNRIERDTKNHEVWTALLIDANEIEDKAY